MLNHDPVHYLLFIHYLSSNKVKTNYIIVISINNNMIVCINLVAQENS